MFDDLAERYAPAVTQRSTVVNGRPVTYMYEDYAAAHALRQADAQAALDDIVDKSGAVMLKIECRDRVIARVYRTTRPDHLDLVIVIAPPGTKINPELHAINQDSGRTGAERITFTRDSVADPLRAPGDRELEHPCRCNAVHELDRRVILERIAMGQRTVTVDDVVTR